MLLNPYRVLLIVLLALLPTSATRAQELDGGGAGDTVLMTPPLAIVADTTVQVDTSIVLDTLELIVHDYAPPYYCNERPIRKAEWFVTLSMGRQSYTFDTLAFHDTVDVLVELVDGMGTVHDSISRRFILFSDPAAKRHHPELTWRRNFTADYDSITAIHVTITGYAWNHSVAAQDGQVWLHTGFTEDLAWDARKPGMPDEPILVADAPTGDTVSDNPVTFEWSITNECGDRPPNYEFQLLRLYGTERSDTAGENIHPRVDWERALSIETGNANRSLTLTISEGTGHYAWRVRPIGTRYPGGIANDRNWGAWSTSLANGEQTVGLDSAGYPAVFYYQQFDDTLNWIHHRLFVEGDSGTTTGESMTYASGLMNARQRQGIRRASNELIVSGTWLDYAGRPALTTLPVPTSGAAFGYRRDLAIHADSTPYGAADFDSVGTWNGPRAIESGLPADYYSDANADLDIPNAEGYPFTRVIFYGDGTSRTREQSGVGAAHRIDSVSPRHTVRTNYGSPAERELIRMFGDEAPATSSGHKVATTDPNGVTSVVYINREGETIATCMAVRTSDNCALDTLVGEERIDEYVDDVIDSVNLRVGPRRLVASKRIILTEPDSVSLYYRIQPRTFQTECLDFCATCDYRISFRIHPADDPTMLELNDSMTVHGSECGDSTPARTWQRTIFLTPGTYIFERSLVANTTDTTTMSDDDPLGRTYLERHLDTVASRTRATIEAELAPILALLDSLAAETPGALDSLRNYMVTTYDPPAADSAWHVVIGCDTIVIPDRECAPIGDCDTTSLDFEAYLLETWGPGGSRRYIDPVTGDTSSFTNLLGPYFGYDYGWDNVWHARVPSNTPPYDTHGQGFFNRLIRNMIADGWNCEDLWACWRTVVDAYGRMGTVDGSGNPDSVNLEHDLLDAFLSCVGTRYEGYSTRPYDTVGEYGYLTRAHRFFRFAPCDTPHVGVCAHCLDSLGLDPTGWTADSTAQWDSLHACVSSHGRRLMIVDDWIDTSCVDSIDSTVGLAPECVHDVVDEMTLACDSICEGRRGAIIAELYQAYHDLGMTVGGDRYDSSGVTPLSDSTEYDVSWWDLECIADRLVAECREGCELTVFFNEDSTAIDSVGTAEQQLAFERSCSWTLEVAIPRGSPDTCLPGYERLGSSAMAPSPLVVQILNDRLRRFRLSMGPEGGWFNVRQALREIVPGVYVDTTADSLIFVSTDTSEVFTLSESCQDGEWGCDCAISYTGDTVMAQEGHALVDTLNNLLDRLWGLEIASAYTEECDLPADSRWSRIHLLDTLREGPLHFLDDLADLVIDSVNGAPRRLGDLVSFYATMEEAWSIRTGDDATYRLGAVDLFFHDSSSVRLRLTPWCYVSLRAKGRVLLSSGDSGLVASNLLSGCGTVSIDTSGYEPFDTVSSPRAFVEYLFNAPYTERIGRFAQDGEGYLIYIRDTNYLRFTAGALPTTPDTIRLCGIRFFRSNFHTFAIELCDSLQCPSVCYRWTTFDPDSIDLDSVRIDTLRHHSCQWRLANDLQSRIQVQIEKAVQRRKNEATLAYRAQCTDQVQDTFLIRYAVRLYHFTLYYHDRAGNLVKTVPPNGVDLSTTSRLTHPSHTRMTGYEYSSIGALVRQVTPDGDTTRYWHDRLGRVRFAQTARQRELIPPRYSYTRYDRLGRTIESGEAMLAWTEDLAERVDIDTFPTMGLRPIVERTRTFYSALFDSVEYRRQSGRTQRYLRNRVGFVMRDRYDETPDNDSVVTAYSYDPHGNVEWMMTRQWGLGDNYVRYVYDLTSLLGGGAAHSAAEGSSGAMREMIYNEGTEEEYRQRYSYDEDSRIRLVESSRDGLLWDRDAQYGYFGHGPLRRTTLGEDSVQGIDYVYTIEGWVKGVNRPDVTGSFLLDDDGPGRTNGAIPRDAFQMTLTFYSGDYARWHGGVGSGLNSVATSGGAPPNELLLGASLYNGNISSWSSATQASGAGGMQHETLTGELYQYDALNRLLSGGFRTFQGGAWTVPGTSKFSTWYAYDPAGNIKRLLRHGYPAAGGLVMDSLRYQYESGTNRLSYVSDSVNAATYGDDIDNQTPGPNYVYDGSGNLIEDHQEGTLIRWNAEGKVEEVLKRSLAQVKGLTIKYLHNPAGNRIRKVVVNNMDSTLSHVTWYVRDANEQMVAIYEGELHPLANPVHCGDTASPPAGVPIDRDCDSLPDGLDNCAGTYNPSPIPGPGYNPQIDSDGDGIGDACDPCTGVYDPWSADYDGDGTPDACDACPADPNGCSDSTATLRSPVASPFLLQNVHLSEWHLYGSASQGRVAVSRPDTILRRDTTHAITRSDTTIGVRRVRYRDYELKDHLGNVRVIITDMKMSNPIGSPGASPFTADMRSYQNYYPFGAPQPGRVWNGDSARYGYNGKEKDSEVNGSGNEYDYGFRVYNPRLGRFLSVDPLAAGYPWYAPYQFAGNMPIWAIDLDGLEPATPGTSEGETSVAFDESGSYFEWTWNRDQDGRGMWFRGASTGYDYKGGMDVFLENVPPTSDLSNASLSGSAPATVEQYRQLDRANGAGTPLALAWFHTTFGGAARAINTWDAWGVANDFEMGFVRSNFLECVGSGYGPGSYLASVVASLPDFQDAAAEFESAALAYYRGHGGSVAGFEGEKVLGDAFKIHLPTFGPSLKWLNPLQAHVRVFLGAIIGGYHGVHASITLISDGEIEVLYSIGDVFGAGVDDVITPGVDAMFFLQHYRSMDGTFFKPFPWFVAIVHSTTESYPNALVPEVIRP